MSPERNEFVMFSTRHFATRSPLIFAQLICAVPIMLCLSDALGQEKYLSDRATGHSIATIKFAGDNSFTIHDASGERFELAELPPAMVRESADFESDPPMVTFTQDKIVDLENSRLRQSVRDARETRRQTRQQFGGLSPELMRLYETHGNYVMPKSAPPIPPQTDTVNTTYSRVRARLDELQRVLERSAADAQSQEDDFEEDASRDTEPTFETSTQPPPSPSAAKPRDLPGPIPGFSETTENAQPQIVEEQPKPPEIIDATVVTSAPVDRMALANNLYGAGEFELALKSYLELAKQPELIPHDQVWVRYQIGQCHRQLGNAPDAQRSFRKVTAVEDQSRWGQHAHWWLQTNERLQRLGAQVEGIQTQVENLKGSNHDKE